MYLCLFISAKASISKDFDPGVWQASQVIVSSVGTKNQGSASNRQTIHSISDSSDDEVHSNKNSASRQQASSSTTLTLHNRHSDEEYPLLPNLPGIKVPNQRNRKLPGDTIMSKNKTKVLSAVPNKEIPAYSIDENGMQGASFGDEINNVSFGEMSSSLVHDETAEKEVNVGSATNRVRRKSTAKRLREYIPAYRSGPYAILLTLYRAAQVSFLLNTTLIGQEFQFQSL